MPRVDLRPALLALAAGVAFASPGPAAAAGVQVAVSPALTTVAPGEEFTVVLQVTEAGASFNGFDAVVEFDPAVLAFLPASPLSQQEGPLMTGACASRFHRFTAAADSLVITDVLLCANVTLTGPGTIYRLRFRAGNSPASTWVRLRPPRTRFYDAGLFVFPVGTADGEVRIGDLTDAGVPGPAGLSVRAWPNPARATATLELSAAVAGPQRVTILDARGRRVRAYAFPDGTPGRRMLAWDGLDQRGHRAVAGWYRVTFEVPGGAAEGSLTLLR
jgi:hypothetical protein